MLDIEAIILLLLFTYRWLIINVKKIVDFTEEKIAFNLDVLSFYNELLQRYHDCCYSCLDDLSEKRKDEILIHDVDPLALTLLVDFAYTGEIVVTEENVQVHIY